MSIARPPARSPWFGEGSTSETTEESGVNVGMSALPFGTGRGRCRFESEAMGPCGMKGSLKTGQENGSGSVGGTMGLHDAGGRVAHNRTPDIALGFFNRCGRGAPV